MVKRDNEKAARALAEALFTEDAKVAKNYGITLRTLQNWRAALTTDPELSHLFATACREMLNADWAKAIDKTLAGAARKLLDLIEGATESDAATITAVAEAIKGLAEIAMTRDVLRAQMEPEQPPITDEDDPALYVN